MKHILFLRHGQKARNAEDHEIPLTAKGQAQAAAVGKFLQESGYSIDMALCSSALRTRQTLEDVSQHVEIAEKAFSDCLYGASAATVFTLIQDIPEAIKTVLIVGHQPGVPAAIEMLASRESLYAHGWNGMFYPECGLASVEIEAAHWADIQPSQNTLTLFRSGDER